MELATARQIIDTLAQGVNPITGVMFAEDSPYNAPPIIRALFAVSQALSNALEGEKVHADHRVSRNVPPRAGQPWSEADDAALTAGFDRGDDLKAIANALGRTQFGIGQRLIKLGKVPAPTDRARY